MMDLLVAFKASVLLPASFTDQENFTCHIYLNWADKLARSCSNSEIKRSIGNGISNVPLWFILFAIPFMRE